jgi:uncharacterized protein (DUF1330 family)
MSVYFIALVDIFDREGFSVYEQGFMDVFNRYGGRLLAVDDSPAILEGDWPHTRTVLMSFPTAEALDLWYRSPEYQAIARHRHNASRADIVVIQGLG